jgi:RibD C-terminal domain
VAEAVGGAHVDTERGLAVGAGRREVEPAAPAEQADAETGHDGSALVLERHRRHRHEDIVGQQPHQGVEVGGLPRGDEFRHLNSLPKYVVSAALEDPKWTNVTVLKGDVVEEVTRLKRELDGDILVYASYQLGQTLIEHDLVDELRLFVFPVVLGSGQRLFGETSGKKPMRLAGSRTVGVGLVFLTYEIVRDA